MRHRRARHAPFSACPAAWAALPLTATLLLGACASAPAASARDPGGTPEELARRCIEEGCWHPQVLGVTSVYDCGGGQTLRTRFNPAANRLELDRDGAPSASLAQQQPPSDVRYSNGDLTWTVTPGQAVLTSASEAGLRLTCRLVRLEQVAGEGIRVVGP